MIVSFCDHLSANAESITKHPSADQHMAPKDISPQSAVGRNANGFSGAVSCSHNGAKDLDNCPDPKRQYVHWEASYMLYCSAVTAG